jgi:glycosyltransferase involved in cell wall biosynthesis
MRRFSNVPRDGDGVGVLTELRPSTLSENCGVDIRPNQVAAALPTISVVIPYLNEEQNLCVVLDELPVALNEVILVDGQSRDRSTEIAREHRPDAVFINQHSPGKGAASIAGLLAATRDIVVLMDADCSMMSSDIHRFVERLVAGADVVHGSRNLPGGGSSDFTRVRSFGNTALTRIANLVYGVSWSDLTFGYMAMWRNVVTTINLGSLIDGPAHPIYNPEDGTRNRPIAYGHGFEVEVLILCRAARAGLVVEEVPSFENKRRQGTSNLNAFRDGLRVANAVFCERTASQTASSRDQERITRLLGAPGTERPGPQRVFKRSGRTSGA